MTGGNLTRDEAEERARLVSAEHYAVELDLTRGETTFGSRSTITFACSEPGAATFVDLLAPAVRSVTLNGEALDPAEVFDGARVHLSGLRAQNVVVIDADAAYSRTGEGLHRFVDPVDGEVYLYTQFEPADSRRLFANFEQPDLKARFQFTVTAPAQWRVWSNETLEELTQGRGRREHLALQRHRADLHLHHRGRGRRLPRRRGRAHRAPARRLGPADPGQRDGPQVPGALLRRRGDPRGHQGRAWTSTTGSSTTRTPSASTTQPSCPSTTSAPWRTPAWSPSPSSTDLPLQDHRRAPTRAAPTRSCTRWRTCGSATWSP